MVVIPVRSSLFAFDCGWGKFSKAKKLTGTYEGKISSCSKPVEFLGESPVLSILGVDLIVTPVSPCVCSSRNQEIPATPTCFDFTSEFRRISM